MAASAIKTVTAALQAGFAEKNQTVFVWADKSDYKDFIRMYVISDFFKGKSEKERLGEIYSVLEARGAKSLIGKISLCIALTKREYTEEFGGPVEEVWLGPLERVYRGTKPRPKLHRLARVQSKG